MLEQELKDIDKPELTPAQLDDVYEAIERGVNEFDFSDSDNKLIASKSLLSKKIHDQFKEALEERERKGQFAEITFISNERPNSRTFTYYLTSK